MLAIGIDIGGTFTDVVGINDAGAAGQAPSLAFTRVSREL
jgi:N-methylhydantoinase A/oxoprolinase/acetone carboxylase beta subunit